MPIYRTGPDVSLDDLVARIETSGERIIAATPQRDVWTLITEVPVDDTGRPHLPTALTWDMETR